MKVQLRTGCDHAEIRVRVCPHNNFELTVEAHKTNVHARMLAGRIDAFGITATKTSNCMPRTMEIGKPVDYAHVDASVLTGDLEASAFDVSKQACLVR